MRDKIKSATAAAKTMGAKRPQETKWSIIGGLIGGVVGLLIGGVGIAAMGGAFGVPASVILAIAGALIGNRYGVELDRRR